MRVLVIDDEKFLADTLVMILRSADNEAIAAYDGAGALSQMESFAPDIVISDVIIPGMDGIEICHKIQSEHPSCRIILFSGNAPTREMIGNIGDKGPSWEVLAKPIGPKELLAKLASLQLVPGRLPG